MMLRKLGAEHFGGRVEFYATFATPDTEVASHERAMFEGLVGREVEIVIRPTEQGDIDR